jgi:hypothetical protein
MITPSSKNEKEISLRVIPFPPAALFLSLLVVPLERERRCWAQQNRLPSSEAQYAKRWSCCPLVSATIKQKSGRHEPVGKVCNTYNTRWGALVETKQKNGSHKQVVNKVSTHMTQSRWETLVLANLCDKVQLLLSGLCKNSKNGSHKWVVNQVCGTSRGGTDLAIAGDEPC